MSTISSRTPTIARPSAPPAPPAAPARLGLGAAAVVAAAGLWGTIGLATSVLPDDVPSESVATVRLALSAPALVLLALLGTRRSGPACAGRGGGRRGAGATVLAGVAMAAYQMLFFIAMDRAGSALGAMITVGCTPVFGGLLGAALARRRPAARWTGGAVLAVAGCLCLAATGLDPAAPSVPLGLCSGVAAGLAYAVFTAASRAAIATSGAGPGHVMALVFTVAAVAAFPALHGTDLRWLGTPAGLGVAMYLALICTVGAYLLYGHGLRTTPLGTATGLTLTEPAAAVLIGVFVLSEPLSAPSLTGLVLIGAALVAHARPAPPGR